MTGRRLVFVPSADQAPPPASDVTVVALDTAWTPKPGDPRHVQPLRPVIAPILARIDLFRDALDRLEAWEAATGVADRMMADGVSWWFRQRPFIWYTLHEHRLWLAILDDLRARDADAIEIRGQEPALTDVARRLVAITGQQLDVAGPIAERSDPVGRPKPRRPLPLRVLGRLRRRIAPALTPATAPATVPEQRTGDSTEAERLALLNGRVARLARHTGRSVVVLSHPRVFQVVDRDGGTALVDPQLAPVMRRLDDRGVPLIHVALELDLRRDVDWSQIESDERLLPDSYVRRHWPAADPVGSAGSSVVERLREGEGIPLDVDGVDLAPILLARLEHVSTSWLSTQRRLASAARGMFEELAPMAMFLNHEGIRTPWMAAARAASVPIHAVQHGVIYPTHPVYRHARHRGLTIPERTYVYGPYERDVLLEHGAYEADEVVVSGSPRLDVLPDPDPEARSAGRRDVRRSLGVEDGSRMLVISTANHVLAWRFHIAEAMARIVGGPLPGVHIVIKLHPGETDDGPYRALIAGCAEAGGYTCPPITIVHDIDLFGLLQAADAHLGFHSTVLTDAVVAGTPNLIGAGHATADWLGYVEAGVARPVRDVTELREALADPRPPDPDTRQAFLERHFRPGDASARIVEGIMARSIPVGTHRPA